MPWFPARRSSKPSPGLLRRLFSGGRPSLVASALAGILAEGDAPAFEDIHGHLGLPHPQSFHYPLISQYGAEIRCRRASLVAAAPPTLVPKPPVGRVPMSSKLGGENSRARHALAPASCSSSPSSASAIWAKSRFKMRNLSTQRMPKAATLAPTTSTVLARW